MGSVMANDNVNKKAVFAAGCFWGVESTFQQMDGVKSTSVGYTGGKVKNPSYELVCTGLTGHAEAVEIEYDPDVISFEKLLDTFFLLHDPTTMNRQGPDIGEQYKSIIFYNSDEEKSIAEMKISEIDLSGEHKRHIVTELREATEFYPAEDYHQNYAVRNGKLCYQQLYVQYKYSSMPD